MSETNNAISLLVQLGVDTNASKANLDSQIEKLSKQLNNLDIKIDLDKDAIRALSELSKLDFKGLSDSIKGAGKGIGGIGDEAKQTGNEIKKSFSDVQKSLDTTFNHLGADFQQAMKKGIVSADELKKAFAGMNASFKMDYEVIGEDSAGQQVRRIQGIEVAYKNLQGQLEKVKFNNRSAIDMGNGELQNLWLPDNTSKVIDDQAKKIETTISNSVRKTQEELHRLVRSGEITEQQFYDLSKASSNIMHPNSIHLYNQRLTETINNNKQLTVQKKEQLAIEDRISKLQNSIIAAQKRDPKGMGSSSNVNGMLDTLNKIDPASKGASEAVKGVSDSFSRLKAESTAAGRDSLTIIDSFKIAMEKFPVWMAASTVFYQTVRSASDAVRQIVALDSQMTTLRRVSGSEDVNKVLQESVRLAGELGNKISDINDGFIAFARQGFEGEELTMLAEYATLLGNISDLSVDESASILTAGLKAFNMETERGIHIVNALNETDNSYSITTKQLAESMQRAAGTASVYGSTLERLIGYTTAIGEITRESGSVIGNSLKSIFSRITSVDGAITALDGIGISVKNQANEMRNVDDILDDLGAQWNSLNAEQQQNIGLQVAGRYQLSRFLVLMNQYDQAMKATETATNSAGSGYRENAEYLKSYEAQINMVKNAWTEAIIAMRDSGLGDGMIVGLNVGLEFFKALTSVIDNVGLLPTVLGTAGAAFLLFSSRADMAKTATNGFLISGLQRIPIVGKTVTAELSAMSIGMQRLAAGTGIAATSFGVLRTALSVAFPIAAIMAVGAALSWVTTKISDQIEKQKMLKKEFEEYKQKTIDAVTVNKAQVDDLITTYSKLEGMKLSGDWDNTKEEEYLRIQQELGDLFPSLVKEIGAKGEKHLIASEAIEKERKAAEELYEIEQKRRLADAKETYKEKIADIEKYAKEAEKAEKSMQKLYSSGHAHIYSPDQLDSMELQSKSATKLFQDLGKSAARDFARVFKEDLAIEMGSTTPELQEAINKALDGVDIPLDENLASKYRIMLSNIGTEMNNAFSSGNREEFSNLANQFEAVLIQMGATEEEARKLVPTFSGVTSVVEKNQKAMTEGAKITDEFGNEIEGFGEETEKAGKKVYKFKDSIEMLTRVYKEQLEDVDDWIYTLKALSGQMNMSDSQVDIFENTQKKLLDLYPHLSSESLKLIDTYEKLGNTSYRAATESDELKNAQKRLLELHPELMSTGISREKLMESIIAKIEEEANANDILLAATIASKKGLLKAEEETTLGHLRDTNARIETINAEILAVDKLEQAYAAFNEDARKKAIETAQGIGMGSAFQAAMKASDFAKQFATEQAVAGRRKTLLAELAKNTADRAKYTDILSQSEAVLANTATSANKALLDKIKKSKDATKAQKNAAKEMEQSIFIADKYKRALEELNLEIKKQQDIQSQFPDYTAEHQKALQKEISLQKDKMALLQEQEKALQSQIKAGKILQTGVVTTKSERSQSLSGWGGAITSQFGPRNTGIAGASTNHQGIDIAGKNGTRVDANVDGTVVFAGNKGNGLGNYVAIKDASGNTNIYGHLQDVLVKAGQSIAKGMSLGTIGSTGTSSGNHLHYQVNDSSGKAINPSSMVDDARKGISGASKEAAQAMADLDSAHSDLIKKQEEIINQENLLNSLILKNINAQLSTFDNKRDVYQRILDYEAEKIKTLNLTSERYIKTLERNTMYLEKKQTTNKKELEYLNQVIKKGGLSGIALETMKIRAEELTAEMLSLGVAIQELSADKINTIMKKFDEGIEDITYSLERSKLIQEAYEEGSLDYNNEAKNQVQLIKEQQQAIVDKRNELQRLILTEDIGAEKAKDYGRQIQQLSLEYWQLENSAKNATKALEDSNKAMADKLANTLIDSLKSVISARRDSHMRQLESEMDAENERHEATLSAIDREMDAEKERHKELQNYYDYQIEMEDKAHKKKMDNLKKQLREFERYIQSQIEGIDRVENTRTYEKDIEKLQKEKNEIQRMLNELAGDDSYEAKSKRKELNKRLEEVDDQLFERRNAREIELRKENYDDLLEKEQLRVEQIEENETKLHEQKLEDIKDLKKREDELHNNNMKNLENRKKAEDATHKSRVNNINDLKKYWTQFYDDQLNNEREFARIREEIVKGNLDALGEEFQRYMDEMIATMPELENTMNGTMQAVGTAVRQNLIDNLREALRLMNEFNAKSNTSRPVSSPSSGSGGSSGSSGGGSSSSSLSSGDLNVLTGKFLNDKLAPTEQNANRKATIKDKGHSLADAGRNSGSTISSTQGFDSVVAGLSKEEKNQLGQYLMSSGTNHVSSDYLKDQIRDYANRLISSSARFDTGGYTGKFIGGKIATVDPEELILNKKDTKTFAKTMDIMDRIFNMINPIKIPSITPPSLAQDIGQGNIEINFNVDKMTGDKNDVDKFTRQVARTLKRERGIR